MFKLILLFILLYPQFIKAAAPTVKVFKYTSADGSVTFTDKKPTHQRYKILHFRCFACEINSTVDWYNTPLFEKKFQAEITAASKTHQVSPALIRAVIHAESAFKPSVISKAGAIGLMQLMPQTAKQLGINKPQQIAANIDGGTLYLSKMLKRFHGSIELATAAYNAGPGSIDKYNGIPPFAETKAYVERVKILHSRYQL